MARQRVSTPSRPRQPFLADHRTVRRPGLRILILLETLTTGGAELFAIRLANALAAEHEVLLAVMHGELVEQPLRQAVSPEVLFEALHLPAKRWWFRADTALRRLRVDRSFLRAAQHRWLSRLVADFRPDIVHSHLLKADWLAIQTRAQQATSFRHVLTMHGDYAPFLAGQSDPQILHVGEVVRSVLDRTDGVVAICDEHRRFLLQLDPSLEGKVETIVNGYQASSGSPVPPLQAAEFRFGMVSRGVRLKGWDVAIEAFALLGRPGATLTLVGEGPHLNQLRTRPLPSNVHLVGATSEPLGYIRQFDASLLPTLFPHESLPTVIIEYLLCGKPVIATDVGEVRTMLTAPDGTMAGRLLDFARSTVSPIQLAGFMAELMDNAALRLTMSQAATQAAKRFDMRRCVEAYLTLYRRLIDGSPSTPATRSNH